MGLDEMYCVDKRFMDGYGGCTDVLMCTQCPDVHPNGPRGSERGQNALLVSRVNGIFGSLVVSAALVSVFFLASILQRWNIWIFLPATRLRQKASQRGQSFQLLAFEAKICGSMIPLQSFILNWSPPFAHLVQCSIMRRNYKSCCKIFKRKKPKIAKKWTYCGGLWAVMMTKLSGKFLLN